MGASSCASKPIVANRYLMKPFVYLLFLQLLCVPLLQGQSPQSPAEFLGYELGSEFSYHHRIVSYVQHVATTSPRVTLIPYGQTYERRPLMVAVVSAPENLAQIDQIRTNNLMRAGKEAGSPEGPSRPIVWLSYNVHGDESVSSEAVMKVLHTLATSTDSEVQAWLEQLVIVLDPCINPDGRDRYAHFYNQYGAQPPNADPMAYEHNQPWPGGRYNHYLFDLNRDWAWQTQQESQQRMQLFRSWMPQVHVDFHEMGVNSPYFFGPAARPFHEVITPWQREFQALIGRNHARYFDKESWLFFTKEVFDLLYPSYGDTWPTYNGAIGFTYEQGGSGRAGLAVETATGDTLTLNDRIDHHYTTSLSTIEVSYQQRERLLEEFEAYFRTGRTNPSGTYKSYLIKGPGTNHEATLKSFMNLLDGQDIQYEALSQNGRTYKGFDYQSNAEGSFSVEAGDLLISAYQPLSRLVQVLMEPKTMVEDSATYDMTAWALPYVYGLEAYASPARIQLPTEAPDLPEVRTAMPTERPLAYLSEWKDFQDARFLAAVYEAGLKVRLATQAFTLKGQEFDRGTLIILRTDNGREDFDQTLLEVANAHEQALTPAYTGFVDQGKDFGSGSVSFLKKPRVAILAGDGAYPTSFGAVWHFFEQQLKYPVTMLNTHYLGQVDLDEFDVLVLCSGNFTKFTDQFLAYARGGGRIIAMETSVQLFANAYEDDRPQTQLGIDLSQQDEAEEEVEEDPDAVLKRYEDRQQSSLAYAVEGSIYRVSLDDSHPLAYGLGTSMHLVKRNSQVYPYLSARGWNVGTFQEDAYTAGFTGSKLKQELVNSLAIGVESFGRGQLIYFPDSPIFRAFWHQGKLLMSNAIFLLD